MCAQTPNCYSLAPLLVALLETIKIINEVLSASDWIIWLRVVCEVFLQFFVIVQYGIVGRVYLNSMFFNWKWDCLSFTGENVYILWRLMALLGSLCHNGQILVPCHYYAEPLSSALLLFKTAPQNLSAILMWNPQASATTEQNTLSLWLNITLQSTNRKI